MYCNLIKLMKEKGVSAAQISILLECRQATVSDKLNGVVEKGFNFEEAQKIKKLFFPEIDYNYLFQKDKKLA